MLQATAAIYGRLSGDATLMALIPGGAWETRAPVDTDTYPLLTYSTTPLRTDYTFTGPYRHVIDVRITALDRSDAVDLAGAVLARVYALLQDAGDSALPMVDFDVLYCRRQTQFKQAPVREGVQFQQVIDGYRLEVRPV